MKDASDKRSEVVRFEDAMVGVIELQLHVLKCRYYPSKPTPDP